MAHIVSLTANLRQLTGKGPARQARFRGEVPAVIYGHGRAAQSLSVAAKALEKALTGVEPESTIIELAVDGKTTRALIREDRKSTRLNSSHLVISYAGFSLKQKNVTQVV